MTFQLLGVLLAPYLACLDRVWESVYLLITNLILSSMALF